MSLHRVNPRRDENEPEVRKRFAHHGWHTEQLSCKGMPDLLCWPARPGVTFRRAVLTASLLVDVKMPKGKLKPAQEKKWAELHDRGIPVYVARTEADVDALVRGEIRPWEPDLTKEQIKHGLRMIAATKAARDAGETFAPATPCAVPGCSQPVPCPIHGLQVLGRSR